MLSICIVFLEGLSQCCAHTRDRVKEFVAKTMKSLQITNDTITGRAPIPCKAVNAAIQFIAYGASRPVSQAQLHHWLCETEQVVNLSVPQCPRL